MKRAGYLTLVAVGFLAVSQPSTVQATTTTEPVTPFDLVRTLWGRFAVWKAAVKDFRTDATHGPRGDRRLFPPLFGGPRVEVSVRLESREHTSGTFTGYNFAVTARFNGGTFKAGYTYTPASKGGPSVTAHWPSGVPGHQSRWTRK